jgi:hypothetical protein
MNIYLIVIMHLPIIGMKSFFLHQYQTNDHVFRYGGLTFGEQIEDDYQNRSHALVWFNNKGINKLQSN